MCHKVHTQFIQFTCAVRYSSTLLSLSLLPVKKRFMVWCAPSRYGCGGKMGEQEKSVRVGRDDSQGQL